jgi:hypothetical protein
MTTMTLTPVRRTTRPVGLALGSLAGTALLVAGVWNALFQEHVTSSGPPAIPAGATPEQGFHTYYTWYAGTVAQERAITIMGLIGVTGLVVLADAVRRRFDATDLLARASCTAIGVGGVVWLTGALIAIGGDRAVGLMATHANPIDTTNSIAFTVNVTADAFSTAAFVVLGLAMVAIGIAPVRSGSPGWGALSVFTGAVSLVVAVGYVEGIDSVTTYVLGLLAAVLLPVWLVWTGRSLDRPMDPVSA